MCVCVRVYVYVCACACVCARAHLRVHMCLSDYISIRVYTTHQLCTKTTQIQTSITNTKQVYRKERVLCMYVHSVGQEQKLEERRQKKAHKREQKLKLKEEEEKEKMVRSH